MEAIKYRGFLIRDYWLPAYAKYEFYEEDWDIGDHIDHANSIKECKKMIDEYLNNKEL